MKSRFTDRRHAGKVLAEALASLHGVRDLTVLALPRGGVPVAFEVAAALRAPLDVFVVRKLGFPRHEEFAMGAVASGGVRVLNPDLVRHFHVDREVIDQAAERERRELERREQLYRGERPPLALAGRTVVLIDDGLATFASMRAAVVALRQHAPARIVVGVPVSAPDTCRELGREVDQVVCAIPPEPLRSVGHWYEDLAQVGDVEIRALLAQAERDLRQGSGRESTRDAFAARG